MKVLKLVFFTCIVLQFCIGGSLAQEARPLLVLDASTYDFGKVKIGTKVEHQFKVSNEGGATLEIRKINTSCGCTAAVVDSNKIEPGQSTFIQTSFDTTGFRGTKEKKISVYTNDPENTTAILTIRGEVIADVWAEPRGIFLGEILKGQSKTGEVLVLSKKEKKIVIRQVRSRSPNLTVDLQDYSDDTRQGKKVSVTIDGDLPIGDFRSRISVHTKSKQEPVINIPVRAYVAGDFNISPKIVSFGVLDAPVKEISKSQVILTNTSSKPIKVLSVKTDSSSIMSEIETLEEGKKYAINFGLKAKTKGIVQSRAIVKTNSEDSSQKEIIIPVYAIINSDN